ARPAIGQGPPAWSGRRKRAFATCLVREAGFLRFVAANGRGGPPLKIAMLGWEFPPFMAGGLGVHCLELTREMAHLGHAVDFYMPRMPSVNPVGVAGQHQHLRITEVDAEPG